MLASILNLFSGGVLGVAGGIFQKWIEQKHAVAEAEMNLKILMEKNKHEANMADKKIELERLKSKTDIAKAKQAAKSVEKDRKSTRLNSSH